MGAHFAQKIVELEKDNIPRESMKSSMAGMDFNHLNDSKLNASALGDSVDPNK